MYVCMHVCMYVCMYVHENTHQSGVHMYTMQDTYSNLQMVSK